MLIVDSLVDETFSFRKKLPKIMFTHPIELMYQMTPPQKKKKWNK